MAADPKNNPAKNPLLAGRRQLHVKQTAVVRNVRMDHEAEDTLKMARERLAGVEAHDRPSVSLIIRRALKVYRGHLLQTLGTPQGLRNEVAAVRFGARLPTLHASKQSESC